MPLVMFLWSLFWLHSPEWTAATVPTLACRLCIEAPVIDGVLNDGCWGKAERATGFLQLGRRGLATQQTECMVSYDAKNLYVAFICFENNPGGIRQRQVLKDGPVWTDDCVEVFLAPLPRRNRYFHLITNLRGTRFDELAGAGLPPPNPGSWDGDWVARTAFFREGWTVEIAISFQSMRVPAPSPGTTWGFNVNRQERRLGELSSWSETDRWFHELSNFGRLVFVPAM